MKVAMKIAVTGATGNVGTALLRRLHADPDVTEIVGVSRRGPDRDGAPYDGVNWHRIDTSDPASASELTEAFQGVDAVVHLVWAIRPNRDEAFLRRTNIDGTKRVLDAAAAAGVPRVVVASSIGAYGPADKRSRKDEQHPTTGTKSSHYAAQKAEVERMLDTFEAEHPDMAIARLRPGLIFQAAAGAEIADYFLGGLVPRRMLRAFRGLRLPVIVFPRGIRAQALHADDVAEAYRLLATSTVRGAFNVAAEPVLGPRAAAQIFGARRVIPISRRVLRVLAQLTYVLRLQPTDPGWIDMAVNAPVMDTSRIRRELGWSETRDSISVVRELLDNLGGDEGLGNARHRSRSPRE